MTIAFQPVELSLPVVSHDKHIDLETNYVSNLLLKSCLLEYIGIWHLSRHVAHPRSKIITGFLSLEQVELISRNTNEEMIAKGFSTGQNILMPMMK
jgi:hypothetical protein